jgi:hypothetical protein
MEMTDLVEVMPQDNRDGDSDSCNQQSKECMITDTCDREQTKRGPMKRIVEVDRTERKKRQRVCCPRAINEQARPEPNALVIIFATKKPPKTVFNAKCPYAKYYQDIGSPLAPAKVLSLQVGRYVCAAVIGPAVQFSQDVVATYGKFAFDAGKNGKTGYCYPILDVVRLSDDTDHHLQPNDCLTIGFPLYPVTNANMGFIKTNIHVAHMVATEVQKHRPQWITNYGLPETHGQLADSIRCLGVMQPFAELIATGVKKVENRPRKVSFINFYVHK